MEEGTVCVAGKQTYLHVLVSMGWFRGQYSRKGQGRELS